MPPLPEEHPSASRPMPAAGRCRMARDRGAFHLHQSWGGITGCTREEAVQITCPPGGRVFSHPPAGRPPAAGRRSGGTGSPRRALSPGAAPGPPCGVWQAFLSQKILSAPGSSFPQLFYGM